MEAAICVEPLLPPFLLLKCQAKITAAVLAVHRLMQQGLPMLKRIKFRFVQFQLHNLLPGPVIGIYLSLYQVQSLSPCCQTDATTATWAAPAPWSCTKGTPSWCHHTQQGGQSLSGFMISFCSQTDTSSSG